MNQNEQGVVFSFRLSGSRMRQSAAQLRRQGQVLDALSLVRRAAEQDDTPSAWQALAGDMRQMGNWEAAARLLARVLSREPHQPGAWIDMARCMQALDQPALAVDCAYHQLHEDPWSQEGDAARAMLSELETIPEGKEPGRTQRLIQRGMVAWQSGQRALGERRIRRALRMTAEKKRLLVTAAMMCMLEMDFTGALKYLPLALRLDPGDARTLTALATLYQQLGKRRISRGFLQRAGRSADSVMTEDGFLAAAWAQDAWQETADYLAVRMRRYPCRTALLSAKATMCCEMGDREAAAEIWRELLSIDPDDRAAASLIAWQQEQPENFINVPGMLPRTERRRQLTEFCMAAESLGTAELLKPGSRTRRLTDWMLESSDPTEMQTAMKLLNSRTEEPMIRCLKELLCRPFLRSEVRQWALMRLADMGCREEMLMLAGNSYTIVQCQPLSEQTQRQPWRMFLPMLLRETRHYGQSREIAELAASLWRQMPDAQRMEAVGSGRYVWCKAMEIFCLRMLDADALAAQVAARTPLSARRISRVLRRIARNMQDGEATESIRPCRRNGEIR